MGRSDENTFRVDLPEGILWVTVRPGREGSGPDAPYEGLLEITTHPEHDTKGYVTLRGRKYSIEYHMRKVQVPFRSARTGEMVRWTVDHVPYNGGNRNESGTKIDYTSPVDDKLDAIRTTALEIFESEFPGWERLSERLHIESDLSSVEGEVSRLARQLREAEAAAAALRSRLDSFRV